MTSTIPWWVNRGRYDWDDLAGMAEVLPPEEDVHHLDYAYVRAGTLVKAELKREVRFADLADVAAFARTLR